MLFISFNHSIVVSQWMGQFQQWHMQRGEKKTVRMYILMDFFCVCVWIYLYLNCVEHAFFPIDKFWCAQMQCNCNRRYGMNDGHWYRSHIMETLMHKSHKSKMFEFNGFMINCWVLLMTFSSLIWTLPHVRFTQFVMQWWFLARNVVMITKKNA